MNYLFGQGMKNIWTNRIMSVASFCILSVSLLLIGFTLLFTANINRFVSGVENKNEVVIFLDDNVDSTMASAMENKKDTECRICGVLLQGRGSGGHEKQHGKR